MSSRLILNLYSHYKSFLCKLFKKFGFYLKNFQNSSSFNIQKNFLLSKHIINFKNKISTQNTQKYLNQLSEGYNFDILLFKVFSLTFLNLKKKFFVNILISLFWIKKKLKKIFFFGHKFKN